MRRFLRRFGVLIAMSLLVAAMMAACGGASTPEEPPEVKVAKPDCSVTIPDISAGMGMFTVLQKLGVEDYPNAEPTLLVNGVEETKHYDLQPNDYIVLAEKPAECNGTYIAARRVSFNLTFGVWREISGFQAPITDQRVKNALQQVCESARWEILDKKGFSGDLVTGGCNFNTGVYTSFADGTTSCAMYDSVNDAYLANNSKLENVTWMEFATTGTGENLCLRTVQP
jgi:hypothetical protein